MRLRRCGPTAGIRFAVRASVRFEVVERPNGRWPWSVGRFVLLAVSVRMETGVAVCSSAPVV